MQTPVIVIIVLTLVCVVSASYCRKVREKYSPVERYVSQHGVPKNITLYWDSEPAKAATVLLAVVLHNVLGYQHVSYQQTSNRIPDTKETCEETETFKEVNIAVSVPAKMRLHLHLATRFKEKEKCVNIIDWASYINAVSESDCGFEDPIVSDQHFIIVNQLNFNDETMTTVAACQKLSSMPFKFLKLNRVNLLQMLRHSNKSFLFVDYDIWAEDQDVSTVELSPEVNCIISPTEQNLDHTVATTLPDGCLIEKYAPQVFEISTKYTLSLKTLRSVLETQSSNKSIEEMTCKWVSNNYAIVDAIIEKYKPRKKDYIILSIDCHDNPDLDVYSTILFYLGLNRYKTKNSKFSIIVQSMDLNCSDPDNVIQDIQDFFSYDITPQLIGIVIGNVKNIEDIAKIVSGHNIPVLLYDANDIDTAAIKMIATEEFTVDKDLSSSMWISTGRSLHLTLAIQDFIHNMGWTRVAVISEQTPSANLFMDNLVSLGGLHLRNYIVRCNLTDLEAENVLQDMKIEDARIILINTDYKNAITILAAGVRLKMNLDSKYAWLLREWRPNKLLLNITHFVISFWCKRSNDVLSTAGHLDHRKNLDELSPRQFWPPQAAALVDAVLTIVYGFEDAILKYPQAEYDTQSKQVIRQFEKSLNEQPVKGITHMLRYKMHMLEEAVVFVEEWYRGRRRLLLQMRVNTTTRKVIVDYEKYKAYSGQKPPDDLASRCIIKTGDPYEPICHDILAAIVMTTLVMSLFTIIPLKICIHKGSKKVYNAVNTSA